MLWFSIRKANIEPELRKTFEQYGVTGAQVVLGASNYFLHQNGPLTIDDALPSLLPWLTEQHDIADRKASWSMRMEIAITVLVLGELVFSVISFFRGH